MQAIWITSEQWMSFTALCNRMGYITPMYTSVNHPKTGEIGYLVDKDAWDTAFIDFGVNPHQGQ